MGSAVRIATAGFKLILKKPRAVLAWGFVYLVFAVVVSLLTRPLMVQMLLAMPRAGVSAPQPPAAVWSLLGPVLVANLGLYGALLILLAAAMRSVLEPEEQGAFWIRVGMDELRLLGTLMLLGLMGFGLYLVAVLSLTIVVAGLAMIAGGAAGMAGEGRLGIVAIVAALMLAIVLAMVVFQVRFMLALPLTLLRGRIVIREAWTRSRGHFWPLFGGVVLGGAIVAGVSLVACIPIGLLMLRDGGGLAALVDPARQAAMMSSPLMIPLWLLTPLLGGFFIAMAGAAFAQALVETEAAGRS